MNNLAPAPAGRRVNPSSSDDLGTTDAAEPLVANDVEARVGEEHSVHPNPLGPKGDPPSVSNDTDREVAALKAQVGRTVDGDVSSLFSSTNTCHTTEHVCGLRFFGSVE